MAALLALFISLAFAQNGSSEPPPCTPCPTTVNTTPQCGTFTITQIPVTNSCGDVTDTQRSIPLSGSSACTIGHPQQINATISCKHNVPVSCEPCCGSPCPADEPRVSGHGG